MSRKIDITGKRFGKLTAIREDGRDTHGIILWLCECECGETCHVRSADLRHGLVKSCGCLNSERLVRSNKSRQKREEVVISGFLKPVDKEAFSDYWMFGEHPEEQERWFNSVVV